ncbi:MAG: hypothetical protein ACJAQT_001243 [Akkermansiaceae bacterium]
MGGLVRTGDAEIEFVNLNSQSELSALELSLIREELLGVDIRKVEYEVTD